MTYKRLVIGVAVLKSPQETYITYLAVKPGWDNSQIATSVQMPRITKMIGLPRLTQEHALSFDCAEPWEGYHSARFSEQSSHGKPSVLPSEKIVNVYS